jgi:hypothetical protein
VAVVVVAPALDTRTARGAVEPMAPVVASSGKRSAVLLRSARGRVGGLAVWALHHHPSPTSLPTYAGTEEHSWVDA